jgi:hypothetical protein
MARPRTERQGEEIDIAAALGADAGVSTQCFSIYIPNKDRAGNEIGNQRKWVLEAIQLLTEINGGATAMPPVEGAWLNDEGEVIWEEPVVVYSYVRVRAFVRAFPRIREFLHRLGRETNQGETVFEFDGEFYRIREFNARGRKQR